MHPKPEPVGPNQESVWDYPRPPAIEPVTKTLRIVHAGETIADTRRGFRVLETSHPPVYYFPPGDCRIDWLPGDQESQNQGSSFCEWKGVARYVDLQLPEEPKISRVGWYYATPSRRFDALAGYLAFYAQKVDECYVGDQRATPQPGGFYGGWVTENLAGPFKGVPGSMGW